ncbi:MAG: dual specificity protein phosphatase family protein [Blastocatellia bacterium]|nr:dual specificity protein phosphatase family protein [Blastocatellia bacterium]
MLAEIYWVTTIGSSRLATMPKPRGGEWLEDEIRSLREMGVDVLVSTLTDEEIIEEGVSLADEPRYCINDRIEFLRFPIPDHTAPPLDEKLVEFIKELSARIPAGKNIAIHCRAGLGRSTTIAACLMVSVGINPIKACEMISAARGFTVPETDDQRNLIVQFADRSRNREFADKM